MSHNQLMRESDELSGEHDVEFSRRRKSRHDTPYWETEEGERIVGKVNASFPERDQRNAKAHL